MNNNSKRKLLPGVAHPVLAIALISFVAPNAALAQAEALDSTANEQEAPSQGGSTVSDEIIVTGTLVRGIAPPGTNVIGVTQGDITATGATTTAQLLQTIPQLGSFNNLQYPSGFGNQVTSNRPNLRTLPGFNTSGGSTTLVLMDGHRLVGMGISSTSPDPDMIPAGAIQRLEIVPDGGSAIYGSDAVAGVMNFITRERYDGVEVNGSYGFADNYYQFDVSGTVGKSWSTGSAYVSYTYTEHDDLFGRDRDYVRQFPSETGTPGLTNLQCVNGNVRIGASTYYGLPYSTATAAGARGRPNQCDLSDDTSFYPKEHRHSVLASVSQELGDAIKLDVKGFYTDRVIDITTGPYRIAQGQPQTVDARAAGFAEHRVGAELNQAVFFQFGPLDASGQTITLKTWGVTPTLTADLGGGWQGRLLGSYSQSDNENHQRNFNTIALTNAVNAGLFNVYDPAASNAAAVSTITQSELYARSKQELIDVRAVIDGELFTLPGGGVKIAAGAEFYREGYKVRTADQVVPGSALTGAPAVFLPNAAGVSTLIRPASAAIPLVDLHRDVKSVFGEVVVPIFGDDNEITGIHELTFSAAGRYDHYSDVGSTFNPKLGLTYQPVDGFKLRASWGESFNAPSLADNPETVVSNLAFSARLPPSALLQSNGGPLPNPAPGQVAGFVQGNAPDIQPQTAETLSLGVDIAPPTIPGLKLGFTYYSIKLNGVIGLPPTDAANVYGPYRSIVTSGPFTAAEIAALNSSVQLVRNTCSPQPSCVYAIVDLRKRNLGNFKLQGMDLDGSLGIDTNFGSIELGYNANLELDRKRQVAPGQPFNDEVNISQFKLRAWAGAQVGNFFGQVSWNHTAGFKLKPPVGFAGTALSGEVFTVQRRVADFNVFDLFFKYDLKGGGFAKDLQLRLNVDNVFDTDPPVYRGDPIAGQFGYLESLTLGRLIQFGVSKKF